MLQGVPHQYEATILIDGRPYKVYSCFSNGKKAFFIVKDNRWMPLGGMRITQGGVLFDHAWAERGFSSFDPSRQTERVLYGLSTHYGLRAAL